MTEPDDHFYPDDTNKDYEDSLKELREELLDYNDSMSRCYDEGWFNDDND